MGKLKISDGVKETIDGRHFGNARGHLIDISNRTQEILTSKSINSADSQKELEQMNFDKKAINDFFERERNFQPKEEFKFDYMKYR